MIAQPLLDRDLEHIAVETLAAKYRREGYEVTIEPGKQDLPPALHDFKPDLIARRGAEGVVAEVKLRRPHSREGWERIDRLAQAIEALPGWRFDLVVIDGPARDDFAGSGRDWSADEIRQALVDVESLLAQNLTEAAVLLLFAAIEARLRELAETEGIDAARTGRKGLITALTTAGLLSREQYRSLLDGLALRDAIAHGRRPDAVLDVQFLSRLLDDMRDLAEPPADSAGAHEADGGDHPSSPALSARS